MEETPTGGDTSHLERDRHCLIQLHWANVISKHLEKVKEKVMFIFMNLNQMLVLVKIIFLQQENISLRIHLHHHAVEVAGGR